MDWGGGRGEAAGEGGDSKCVNTVNVHGSLAPFYGPPNNILKYLPIPPAAKLTTGSLPSSAVF